MNISIDILTTIFSIFSSDCEENKSTSVSRFNIINNNLNTNLSNNFTNTTPFI